MKNETNRILKTFGYGSLNFFSNFINKYLIFPLIIFYWGNDIFNEWILITNIALQLSLFEFGSKIYLGNKLATKQLKIEIYYKYLATINFISFTCILLSLISIIFFFNFTKEIQNLSNLEFNLVIIFATLIIVCNIIIGSFGEAILRPSGLYYKYQKIDFIFNFFISIILLLSLFLNTKIVIYTAVNFFLVLLKFYYLKIYIQNININVSNIFFNFAFFNLKKFKIIIFNGFFFYLGNIVNLIQTSTLILVGTLGMGVNLIGTFVVHRTLVSISNQITNILALSFTYEYTKATLRIDDERLMSTNIKISNYMTIFFCTLLYIFGELIFNFWLQSKILFYKDVFYIFIITCLIRNYGTTLANFLWSKNKHIKFNSIILLISIILIPIGFILSKKYAISGLAYTYLVYETIFLIVGFSEIYLKFKNLYKLKFFFIEILKIIIFIFMVKYNNLYLLLFIFLLLIYDIRILRDKKLS